MPKNIPIVVGITILIVCIGLSGCFDNNSDTVAKADLIMTEPQTETNWDFGRGYYVRIYFIVENIGSANVTDGRVRLYSTDQDEELKANSTDYLPPMSPNELHGVSFEIDYEIEDTLLNNKITLIWASGYREYSQVINL